MELVADRHYTATELRQITGLSWREIVEVGPVPCWLHDVMGQRLWCGSEILRWVDSAEARFRNQQMVLPGMESA